MAVPTVYIGKAPQPQTELDDIDTPGAVPAQWSPVGDVPLPSGQGAGEWSAIEDVPLSTQGAQADQWAPVEDVPLPGSGAPVRGGAPVGAGADQPPVPAPLDPAVQAAGQESKQFFGREFDLAPSSGLVMRPDDRSWAEKFRGIIPDPFRIPQRTAERFNEGVQTMQQPGVLPKIIGGAQAVFSPISGATDALARDPVLNATGDLKKANDAKLLAETITPGIGMSLRNFGPAVAGRAARDAPEIAANVPRLPAPAPGLPPLEPPVNPLGRPIPTAEEVMPGTQVGGAGGGGKPPIDRNASPGEFVEPPQRPLSPDEKEVLGSIGKRPGALAKAGAKAKDMLAHPQETADNLVSEFVDNLHPLRVADRALEAVRQPGEATIHELARNSRGAPGGAREAIQHGTYDFKTGQQTGPGLMQVLKDVNADGLRAYMMSRRTLELAGRGVKSGVDVDAARKVVQQTGGYYERAFRDVVDFQDRILNFYKDAGFVSDSGYRAMKQLNQEYVPLQKIIEGLAANGGVGGNLRVRQIINKIKGSDEYKNVDPLKSIVDNTYTMITLAERNRALTSFLDRVERLEGPLVRKVDPPAGRKLIGHNNGPSLAKADQEIADQAKFISGRSFHPEDNTFAVWRNGRPEHYRTTPEIAAAIKGLGEVELDGLFKILSYPARWVRQGVTTDPFYLAKNILWDTYSAASQSKSGFRPGMDTLSGLKSIATKDEAYHDVQKYGGAQSVRYSGEYDPAKRDLNMIGRPGVLGKVRSVGARGVDALTAGKEALENSTKVGEYKRALKKLERERDKLLAAEGRTATPTEQADTKRRAAFQSRTVTQDFQARGANKKLQQWNSLTAFMNGAIQGQARSIENAAFSGKKQALKSAVTLGALPALAAVYTWRANKGDPRYDDANRNEKDRNFFVLPGDPKALPWKIPTPPGLEGQVAGAVQRALDAAYNKNPDAFKGFLEGSEDAFLPPVVPTFAAPIAQHLRNKNFFGGKIETDRDEQFAPAERYSAGTSEVAKKIGQALGWSPKVVDNYISGLGGTSVTQGVKLFDKALRDPKEAEREERDFWTNPFVRRFRIQSARQPISDFYDNFRRFSELKKTSDDLQKRGLPERAKKYMDQIGANLQPAYTKMSLMNSGMRQIQNDQTMSPQERKIAMSILVDDMIELAKDTNAKYHVGQQAVRERNP